MNELTKVFNYQNKQVRTVLKDGEPWFVAKDVCEILELERGTRSLERLDDDEVRKTYITDSIGRNQESYIVSEAGLYSLVLTSNKPEAKMFKRWITHDVIPAIRNHGVYMTPETIEKAILNPDFVIDLATRLKEEQIKRLEAETKMEEQKPLVTFAESCIASKDSMLVRELAKLAYKNGIEIGEKRLYKKLREWGLILKDKTEPSQRAMNMELFEIKKCTKSTPYGVDTYETTMVTPRGQIYIIERLKREAA